MNALAQQQRALKREIVEGGDDAAARVDVTGLLRIYRHAYAARLIAALRDNFGVLPRAMGDEAFEALGRAYLQAHPSSQPSIRWFGHALADFMAPLAPALRLGLAEFELTCRAQHAGTEGFATLSSAQQVAWLQQVEHTPFFNSVQQLTVLGALSMPDYGGNHNGLGWQLIGFEDLHAFTPPFGYYDRDYPGFDAAAGKS